MASTYTTGTINQPDAGSVGLAMAERLRDDVVAHAAWELVEEFTPGSGTVRWYVFRCLAAQSGLGSDFYVVMGRTLANGELRFCICEEYDTPTHAMKFFPKYGNNNAQLFDSLGRVATTFSLGTSAFDGSSPQYWDWDPTGTSTKWWIIVTEDSFTVAFNGPSNGFVHIGAYTPLSALPIALPIQIMGSQASNSGSYGAITRNPAVAGATVESYAHTFQARQYYLGFLGDLRYNDRLQANQRPVAELALAMYSGSSDWPARWGFALGKHKRICSGQVGTAAAGFAFGDAYALGGTLWVPYLPTDTLLWDTGVASS